MKPNVGAIVRDIRTLSRSNERRYHRDAFTTNGVLADALRIREQVDLAALQRSVAFALSAPPKGYVRGYRAALRLARVLQSIERCQAEIETHLRQRRAA